MWRTTPFDRRDRRLHRWVTGVVCLGSMALAVALADLLGLLGGPHPAPPWQGLAGYAVLVVGSGCMSVRVRIGSTGHGVNWTDAVVLVGLATLPVPWVVLATAAGTLAARLITRRPPIKIVFAVAKEAAVALAGGLVLLGLSRVDEPALGWTLLWLVAAFAAMSLVDTALTIPVVAFASGTPVTERLRANRDISMIALVGRLAVALVAVVVLDRQPQLVYALPLLVLLGHVWHEQWVRAREERRAWQEFAAATESFAEVDLDTVLRRAVTGGARLFSAEVFEVELRRPAPPRLVRSGPDQLTFAGDPADAPPEPDRTFAHELPLHGGPGQPAAGALRLRFGNRVALTEREHALLASFATALETAVRNATAYRMLRHPTP